MPIGVTIVAFLTLLSCVVLAYLLIIVWVVSCVGMGGGIPISVQNLPYYLSWLLPIFAFLFSVGILGEMTSRYLWYGLLVYWIAFFTYFVLYYGTTGIWIYMFRLDSGDNLASIARILFLPSPFVYAVGCSVYFLTKTPQKYFHISDDKVGHAKTVLS
jgi:hypothetical protein